MAEDEGYLSAAEFSKMLHTSNVVDKARTRMLDLLQQSIDAPAATLSLEMLEEVMRSIAVNGYFARSVPRGSFHASTVFLNPKPVYDAFGTDLRTVDRMANPHRPGTPEHTKWMKQWANVQPHFQTQAYLDEKARVEADQERMNETYGPMVAPGWADAVLAEIEEAREECENVVEPDSHFRVFLDECVDDDYWADSWVKTEDVKVKLFTKDDPQRVFDLTDFVDEVTIDASHFTKTDDGLTDDAIRYGAVYRLGLPGSIKLNFTIT